MPAGQRNPLLALAKRISIIITIGLPSLFKLVAITLAQFDFPLHTIYFGVINIYSLMEYAPYFLFGILLGRSPMLLRRFSTISLLLSLPTALRLYLPMLAAGQWDHALSQVAVRYPGWLSNCLLVTAVFPVFYRFSTAPANFLRAMSDRSCTLLAVPLSAGSRARYFVD